jgi:hypothetical protein
MLLSPPPSFGSKSNINAPKARKMSVKQESFPSESFKCKVEHPSTVQQLMNRASICKRLRRPGIDSEDLIPPAFVAWRAGMTNRVVVPARQAGNRLLGSLKGLK